jgi:hypothetical protein
MTANNIRGVLLNFGNQINQVRSRTSIDDMDVTAGRFDEVGFAGDMTKSEIGVGGPIGNFHIGGALRGSSALLATGPMAPSKTWSWTAAFSPTSKPRSASGPSASVTTSRRPTSRPAATST